MLPCSEQKRHSVGIQRTSCPPILQVHLLISSHSWIRGTSADTFLLRAAASYTHAARSSKIRPCREGSSTLVQPLLGQPPPCSSEVSQCQRTEKTLKPVLLEVSHRKLQSRASKAQVTYTFLCNADYPTLIPLPPRPFFFKCYSKFCDPAATALTSAHTHWNTQHWEELVRPHWVVSSLRAFQLGAQKQSLRNCHKFSF